jgi:hypothetical protein
VKQAVISSPVDYLSSVSYFSTRYPSPAIHQYQNPNQSRFGPARWAHCNL